MAPSPSGTSPPRASGSATRWVILTVVASLLLVGVYLIRPLLWLAMDNGFSIVYQPSKRELELAGILLDGVGLEKSAFLNTNSDASSKGTSAGAKVRDSRSVGLVVPTRREDVVVPPLDDLQLSKELLDKYADKDKNIIATFANYHYLDFVLNWAAHMNFLGVDNFVIGCLHDELVEDLYKRDLPVFALRKQQLSKGDFGWGSHEFHKGQRSKVDLVAEMTAMGFHVFFSDVDIVWYQNPLPYLLQYPTADLLISSDNLASTAQDGGLEEMGSAVVGTMNVGIMWMRATPPTVKLLKEWADTCNKDPKYWDQAAFNDIYRRGGTQSIAEPVEKDKEKELFLAYEGTLKMGTLPVSRFCSGHTYFVQHLGDRLGLSTYGSHATFQYGGTEGKRHRFREDKSWVDPAEYYDPPNGFLTYQPRIPEALLTGGEHTVETHFNLVNYQLLQVRTAYALSTVLNRTLIMPAIWCRLDRWWAPHSGMIPGSVIDQPFLCPLDHVFDIPNMVNSMEEAHFGPQVDIREYSILDNPRIPVLTPSSRVLINLCDTKTGSDLPTCGSGTSGINSTPPEIEFPLGLNGPQWAEKLLALKDVKVIEFTSMAKSYFAGFGTAEEETKFRNRIKMITSIWCCVGPQPERPAGHIYYDIYWDEKPGWKPQQPLPQEDHRPF